MMNKEDDAGFISSDEDSVCSSESERDEKDIKDYAKIVLKHTNFYTSECNLANKRNQYSGFDRTYRTHLSHFFHGKERTKRSMENACCSATITKFIGVN